MAKVQSDIDLANSLTENITDKTDLVESKDLTSSELDDESTVTVSKKSVTCYEDAVEQINTLISQLNDDVDTFKEIAKWLDDMDKLLASRQ